MKLSKHSMIGALLLMMLAAFSPTSMATPDCTNYSNTSLVTFPDVNPVWEMCVRRPGLSTPGPNGSGVEIFEVTYNGHLVMERGNVPGMNVQYAPGGCGCFRDWMDSEADFEATTTSCADFGICEVSEAAQTICDCAPTNSCDENPNNACNTDIGTYRGVAVQKTDTQMTLTTHARAGWYRYTMIWVFHLDGTIEPRFKFGATPNGCTDTSHNHHGFYRFDFDINGADGDSISESTGALSGIDTDSDSIDDTVDNCIAVSNVSQTDADGDGFGNHCDADYNNDNVVNFLDLNQLSGGFLGTDPIIDLNGDGVVNFIDVSMFGGMFLAAPGPAGPGINSTVITTEKSSFANDVESWTVSDNATGRGYQIIPGTADLDISDAGGINNPEDFAVGDYWVLNENSNEQGDPTGGCETNLNNYVNGENTEDTDVVFWLRFGTYHQGLDECFCGQNGPRLVPVGDWSPAPTQ